jgi:hypothetical protein
VFSPPIVTHNQLSESQMLSPQPALSVQLKRKFSSTLPVFLTT